MAQVELEQLSQAQEAHEAAFRLELAAFAKRQELAAEKERTVEHQRQLVADQAAALETQRQALRLQQQQLHDAQRVLENNRQAAAVAQEQRGRVQAAAVARLAAEEIHLVVEEAVIQDPAQLDQAQVAANHALQQQQIAAVAAENARLEEANQARVAAAEADRLAEQQRQLVIEAAIILARDAPVVLPLGVAGPPAVAADRPADAVDPPAADIDQPARADQPAAAADLDQVGK